MADAIFHVAASIVPSDHGIAATMSHKDFHASSHKTKGSICNG